MTQKNTNPWTFDVRVRERNIKSGSVSEKDIEAYLAQLPDLESQSEPFSLAQPALEGEDDAEPEVAPVVAAPAPAPVAAAPVAAPPVAAPAPPVAVAPAPAPAPAAAPAEPEPAAPVTDVVSEPGT